MRSPGTVANESLPRCAESMDYLPTWKVKNGSMNKGKWLDNYSLHGACEKFGLGLDSAERCNNPACDCLILVGVHPSHENVSWIGWGTKKTGKYGHGKPVWFGALFWENSPNNQVYRRSSVCSVGEHWCVFELRVFLTVVNLIYIDSSVFSSEKRRSALMIAVRLMSIFPFMCMYNV